MANKVFRVDEPVWAKMKGWPAWPARILETSSKKKDHHYVCFFGTGQVAWIPDKNISRHNQSLIGKYAKKKNMQAAISEITEYCRFLPFTIETESSSSEGNLVTRKRKRSSDTSDSIEEIDPSTPICIVPTQKKIGLMGLGEIGINILRHLVESGHNITVYDPNEEIINQDEQFRNRVGLAKSPKELALKCEIIVSCALDIDELIKILYDSENGVRAGLRGCNGAKGYIEVTSVGEEKAKEIAELIKQTGATFLEAPVTGIDLVETGKLYLFASGNAHLFNSCKSIFQAISSRTKYVNDKEGLGNAITDIINSMTDSMSEGLAKALDYGRSLHIPLCDMILILTISGVCCDLIESRGLEIYRRDFSCKRMRTLH